MFKFNKKAVISIVLSIIILFFAGCGKSKKSIPAEEEIPPVADRYSLKEYAEDYKDYYAGGTHIYNSEATDEFIVRGGESLYKIVIPSSATAREIEAQKELEQFFLEATGVRLNTIEDSEVEYSADAKFISIGETSLLNNAGLIVNKQALGSGGLRIVTKGKSIFLFGATDFGALNAVYELLHQLFGFRVYAADEIAIDKKTDVMLYNFDITDIPDIEWRQSLGYGEITGKFSTRMRLGGNRILIPEGGHTWHNSFQYLPKSEFQNNHSDWYSVDGSQLCYTARGKTAEYEAMQKEVADQMLELLEKNPASTLISFTQEDDFNWCACSACQSAANEKYGGVDSGVLIKFANDLSAKVQGALDAKGDVRQIKIIVFSYNKTLGAPVRKNSQGQYEAVSEEVNVSDNVAVLYAPAWANYSQDFYSDENAGYLESLKQWSSIANNLFLWLYSANFNAYLVPFNTFNSMQNIYKAVAENNGGWVYDQAQWNQKNSTAFGSLKVFLSANLLWNVNLDFGSLINEYFEYYFKDAALPMRRYFDGLRARHGYMESMLGVGAGIYDEQMTGENYPYGTLKNWEGYIGEAYQTIKKYENTDPELYQKLYDRINKESISIRYMLIELYGAYYSNTQLMEMKIAFKNDALRLNISHLKETSPISELFGKWGV